MSDSYPNVQLLIANEWVDAASGKTLDVRNPATGQVIGSVAHAGIADLDRALAAAQAGFEVWRFTSVYEVQPSHNPLGPFDLAGTHDGRSDRSEVLSTRALRLHERRAMVGLRAAKRE